MINMDKFDDWIWLFSSSNRGFSMGKSEDNMDMDGDVNVIYKPVCLGA